MSMHKCFSKLCKYHSRRCVVQMQTACFSNNNAEPQPDYAVEMAFSNIRFGQGVVKEVGKDMANLKAKKVLLMTDKNLCKLPPVQHVQESLEMNNINYECYSDVRVEPTDESFKHAIRHARDNNYDAFIAVGGGSVIDTCKATNLYASNPEADFLDFVNAPIGKAKPVMGALKPLVAVATTAGTGSETTGATIFDYLPLRAKTGIASRAIKPTLGIVDPETLLTCPERVTCYSGFDVLCHAVESFTAIPFNKRVPRPSDPALRPAYQGSNPISDVWSKHALSITSKYLIRAIENPDDLEAKSQMHLASAFAGIGFGNAGVHLWAREADVPYYSVQAGRMTGKDILYSNEVLCSKETLAFKRFNKTHGMSYPISGLVKDYVSPGYDPQKPLIPHGLSVIVTAPAVFRFTSCACPERHIEAAALLGADVSNVKPQDAGSVLADVLLKYMDKLKIPDGISALGFTKEDIPALVEGTLPQERVTKLSPRKVERDNLFQLFEDTLKIY